MSIRFSGALGVAAALACLSASGRAQISTGGSPPSFLRAAEASQWAPLRTEAMPPVDVAALLREDELTPQPAPFRFGATIEVALDAQTDGAWEVLADGSLLWRLRISSPGALSLNLIFDRFWVPPGGELFLYDDARSIVRGAFTSANVKDHGMFAIAPIPGDALTLEYREPAGAFQSADFSISKVVHGYRDIEDKSAGAESGSGSCNVNVVCPVAAGWQEAKRSVARIVMTATLCTGALLTNTAEDARQFFLTANHCHDGLEPLWVFEFNYEGATCSSANAPNPSSFNSVSGALLRALSPSSDFCLVELSEPIPASFRPYFAGWDRRGTPVVRSAGIHHPEGDIKKICFDHDPADKVLNTGIETWHIASWDLGVTEPGSSGSPLFDQNQRVVGQLFGGEAACGNVVNDYYGRLEISWDLGMSLWLDPLGGGEGYMDGMELGAPPGNPHTYCTAKTTSLGSTAAIGWSGSTSVAANDLLVQCSGAIPNKLGLVFFGSQPRSAPFYGGWLCATSPLKRSPLFAFDSSGFHAAAASSADEDVATTRYYQFWFRDGGHPDGTGVGLSDALKVTFDP